MPFDVLRLLLFIILYFYRPMTNERDVAWQQYPNFRFHLKVELNDSKWESGYFFARNVQFRDSLWNRVRCILEWGYRANQMRKITTFSIFIHFCFQTSFIVSSHQKSSSVQSDWIIRWNCLAREFHIVFWDDCVTSNASHHNVHDYYMYTILCLRFSLHIFILF